MGQVLHGNATTTAAVRRARALAKRYGINQKTVAKLMPYGRSGARSPIADGAEEPDLDCADG
jgi:hypothetical protein